MNAASPLPSIFDTQSLSALKKGLRKDDPQALKAAAQQFEAVFLQMMLKSMRATVQQDGLFDSDQTRFYQELLDSQLAQAMAAKGGTGLAAVIERQLSRASADTAPTEDGGLPLRAPVRPLPLDSGGHGISLPVDKTVPAIPLDSSPIRPALPLAPTSPTAPAAGTVTETPAQGFTANVWSHAVVASGTTGIPPQFLVAHAALESGWGKSEPRFADGRPSYNLFGIKAGSNWQGATVEATTTEYVNGVAEKRVERFRAYGSYAESFRDYAQLLAQSPRYAGVVGSRDAASFAQGLQRAGYATDPAYASKLERVIGSLAMLSAGMPKA